MLVAAALVTAGMAADVQANDKLDQLLQQVKKDRLSEGSLNKKTRS